MTSCRLRSQPITKTFSSFFACQRVFFGARVRTTTLGTVPWWRLSRAHSPSANSTRTISHHTLCRLSTYCTLKLDGYGYMDFFLESNQRRVARMKKLSCLRKKSWSRASLSIYESDFSDFEDNFVLPSKPLSPTPSFYCWRISSYRAQKRLTSARAP